MESHDRALAHSAHLHRSTHWLGLFLEREKYEWAPCPLVDPRLPKNTKSSFWAAVKAASVSRTRTLSETRGFMKALIATNSDHILGFTVFGIGGGEIMGAVQIAMIAGLPYTAVRDAVLTHPTCSKAWLRYFRQCPQPNSLAAIFNEGKDD
jgi:hypothetical protein